MSKMFTIILSLCAIFPMSSMAEITVGLEKVENLGGEDDSLPAVNSPEALLQAKLEAHGFVVTNINSVRQSGEMLVNRRSCDEAAVTKVKVTVRSAYDYYEILGTWQCSAEVIGVNEFKGDVQCSPAVNGMDIKNYLISGENRAAGRKGCFLKGIKRYEDM